MKLLGRFVTRDTGEADSKDGLFVGTLTKAGRERFKPGHVFAVVEVMDEVVIKELGPSHMKPTIDTGRTRISDGVEYPVKSPVCWSSNIGDVLDIQGKHLFLTEAEYVSLCEGNHD